ncbi:hypothetical protein, partial [Yersinia massiliensis]|uniref:hypothetical protein n=1 Tax=Yersinia massiliensis TaxID=419257 RepID=UPI001C9773A0
LVASTESGRWAAAQHPRLCAKYCPAGKPPTSFGSRASAMGILAQTRFSRASCPLTLPFILVGNFSDCAQRQKIQTKSQKIMVLILKFKSTFELPSEESRQGKRAGRPF